MTSDPAIHSRIIENVDEGIVTVGRDGMVIDFNPAASALLGLDSNAVLGQSFATIFLADERNDAFAQAMVDSMHEANVVHNQIVAYHRADAVLTLSLSTSFLKDKRGDRQGVIAVFRDITEIEKLREAEKNLNEELKENNRKLSEAYLNLEDGNKRLQSALKQMHMARMIATGFVILFIAGVELATWRQGGSIDTSSGSAAKDRAAAAMESSIVTVARKPFHSRIKLTGVIQPVEVVNIPSSLSGYVLEMHVRYGDRVERGQPLFTQGTEETAVQFREAEVARIDAMEKLRHVENWNAGPEVARARRALTRAKDTLDSLRLQLEESQRLLDLGIVPKSEHRGLQERVAAADMEHRSAQEDLQNTLNQGGKEARRTAQLRLANAEFRMRELENKIRSARVLAPVSGVVLLPPEGKDGVSRRVEVGTKLQEGAVAISIGNLEGVSVKTLVDEIDIRKLQVGQKVLISGDAFPGITLEGAVVRASSEASQGKDAPVPTFEIIVQAPLANADQQKQIRVGMSSILDVLIHDKPDALMLPLTAIHKDSKGSFVLVSEGDKTRRVPVRTGLTDFNSVEVTADLKEGDKVLAGPSARTAKRP